MCIRLVQSSLNFMVTMLFKNVRGNNGPKIMCWFLKKAHSVVGNICKKLIIHDENNSFWEQLITGDEKLCSQSGATIRLSCFPAPNKSPKNQFDSLKLHFIHKPSKLAVHEGEAFYQNYMEPHTFDCLSKKFLVGMGYVAIPTINA
ncbi:hypothetical protein J437_LFUL004561 [Ladona fulva]|uniref:Uncharacterized protein n=1 Tax=Ladona fulva TaxID=123851 RepID=A0A8K0JV94_LADFU|nr:hypothetical protein J437_LFUL004561 [Ladona fulva]